MTTTNDWNASVVAEFRANGGKVGGHFDGAPLVIMHHVGRKSGTEFLAPVMYLRADDKSIYVFASAAGALEHPDWYRNMIAAGTATVEVGTETYPVTVREISGEDRDRVYAEHAALYPGFAEYEVQTAGVRTIPVLELTRSE